jgi:acid phosphatase type 7
MTFPRVSLRFAALLALAFLPSAVSAQLAGFDEASRYSGNTNSPARWMNNGSRGDTHLGPWLFEFSPNGGAAGSFIGDSSLGGGDINTSAKSFGLFANPPGSPAPSAGVIRKFAKPALTTGDKLSFKVAVNFRNGSKGFTLRNAAGTSQWNFTTGRIDGTNDGYYIRNGVSGSAFDNGQRFGGYHANTIFTFTFTQRERQLDWTAVRSGGISNTVTGTLAGLQSGTIADVRFFVTGTDAGGLPQNNLYCNSISLETEPRGDLPLTLGERRLPGRNPSYFLRFVDPVATAVTMRHGGDGFTASHILTKGGDGVWSMDIRTVGLSPGWHYFKFRLNSVYEAGPDRALFLDGQGRIAKPSVVYLTWQRDPTTTMTVHWHNYDSASPQVLYRKLGEVGWLTMAATTRPFAFSERLIHTAEATNLLPDSVYEFTVSGDPTVRRFRTMPTALTRPVTFVESGDIDVGAAADAMASTVAALNPDFAVWGGDIAYPINQVEDYWEWYRLLESWMTRGVRPVDGCLIPLVVGLGNHEVRDYYASDHPDAEETADWREQVAPHFYRMFAFPGQPGYGVLDFGAYLTLVLLDTDHTNPIAGNQTTWLAGVLEARRHVKHLLPVYHVPAYPSNRSFSDARNALIRANWLPLFEGAGVHLAFEHHDHAFKRTKPMLGGVAGASDGIVFLGDGAWGVATRPPDPGRTYLATAEERRHIFLVTLGESGRTVQAIDVNGVVFDSLTQSVDGYPPDPAASITDLAPAGFQLSWSSVPNAVSYRVLRDNVEIATTAATSFTDTSWTTLSAAVYRVVAVNRSGQSTNVGGLTAAPRQRWAVDNSLPWNGTGDGAMTADPDMDGRPNIAEYFHGLNPRAGDTNIPLVPLPPDSGTFSLLYRRNPAATDVNGQAVWINVLGPGNSWSAIGVSDEPVAGTSGEWRRASVPVAPEDASKFLRLNLTD